MSRLLTVLLALTLFVLVTPPPAHAALSVTISASPTTLAHGSSVTFTGKAVGARRGSVVKLQRKAGLVWRTVASRKVRATRAYRFTTTPPKGYQHYRVLKPRQLGQPAVSSRTAKLTVHWRPSVVLGEVRHDVDTSDGSVTTTATGSTKGLPEGVQLRRELRASDGTWTSHGWVTVTAERSWRDTFTSSHGRRLRYTAPADGPRRAASSASFLVDGSWTPTLLLGDVSREVDPTDGSVTTTATGSTDGVPAGTQLRREVQQSDGSWATHGWATLDADHSWRDTFAGSHGMQLRYTAPAAPPRQAASSASFVVDGSWTPTVTATATMDSLTDQVTVTGSSTGLPLGVSVQREYADADSWVAQGVPVSVAADGTFSDAFAGTMNRAYRYRAPASGQRHEASSAPFELTDAPAARVSLDSTTTVVFPAGGTERKLLLHLDEGQEFTFDSNVGPWSSVAVADPAGAAVPGFSSGDKDVTARATVSGDHTITIAVPSYVTANRPRTITVTLSQPVVVETALEDPGVDLHSTLPGQVVDLRFTAAGGSVISEYSADHTTEWGYSRGTVSLLDPSGAVVPHQGRLLRQGHNWRLPAASGEYTLRVTPSHSSVVNRRDQSILVAYETTTTLDGAPGHLSFDRPGRVGVVRVTVPEGTTMGLTNTKPFTHPLLQEERFGPDGQLLDTFSSIVDPTAAGTYTQLMSMDGTAEVDFYAWTPKTYDAAVGSTVAFDQGPAPHRRALVRIPVTAGQLFSLEVLDDAGDRCSSWAGIESSGQLEEWITNGNGHPTVVKIAQNGELVLGVTPCTSTGTFRLQPTAIVPSEVSGATTDHNGDVTTTSTATLEATEPGQVMIMEYDGGSSLSNRIDLRATGSTFPGETTFTVSEVERGSGISSAFYPGTVDTLEATLHNQRGPRYFFVYPGPTATGTLDLELTRLDW
jgi:hypothetical protein